ncbi:MAG TPA: alpha/beta fold hydrolase [Opitutaceae bacterium]
MFLAVVLVGPRVPFDDTIRPAQLPDHLDGYLAESEGRFSDLTPDTEKMILWANEAHEATALSIVYLHGFSAIRQETAPLCEHLARRIGASVFQTRLTGHGRPGTALGDATANDWLNDAHEAFEIGCRIGRKVILLGVSTGGTLAVWLDLQADRKRIEALVLVSPNFRLKDKRAEMVTGPWGGEQVALALAGPEVSWQLRNERHGRYWTSRYPTRALLPMIALIKHVRKSDLERIEVPLLVAYSTADGSVDPPETEHCFARFGSAKKRLVDLRGVSADEHVLAGDILAPAGTPRIEELILEFIAQRPEEPHNRGKSAES